MRLKGIRIQNGLKRFADLTVTDLPESARLIVLLGPNGSGKTSLLEALFYWHKMNWHRQVTRNKDPDYYQRPEQTLGPSVSVEMYGASPIDAGDQERAFHFRTAYRYTSDFTTNAIGGLESLERTNKLDALVDEDRAVASHYNRLVGLAVSAFAQIETEVTNTSVYSSNVAPLAESMNRLFPDLHLTGLGDPTNKGTFLFTKGVSKNFRYVNLSSGEKAAFDLLLDLHVRKEYYPDCIICLDEPEAHMGLRVQRALLDEILRILPASCQVIIASHSAGMMRRAFEIAQETPNDVVFLDFDGHNFDEPVVIRPSPTSRRLWQSLLATALEDMATLVAPTRVYVCEGDPDAPTPTRRSFDATVFSRIFANDFATVDFVSAGGVTDLPPVARSIVTILPGTEVYRIVDRDGRTDQAVADLKSEDPTLRVLSVRDLENYLLSDEIFELGSKEWAENPEEATSFLIAKKQELLNTARYPDDVKQIAGSLFTEAKQLWRMDQPGQDRHEFIRDICAPLIQNGTQTYAALVHDLGL